MKHEHLKMDNSTVQKDLLALERYRKEEIDFKELVAAIKRNNKLDYLSSSRVRELLNNSGFERGR